MFWNLSTSDLVPVPVSRIGFLWIESYLSFSLPSEADIQHPARQPLESCILDDTGNVSQVLNLIVVMVTLLGSSPARPLHNLKKNHETLRDEEPPPRCPHVECAIIVIVSTGRKHACLEIASRGSNVTNFLKVPFEISTSHPVLWGFT